MPRMLVGVAVVASLAVVGVARADAEVQLSIANGQVTLDAKDATVRQILTEWARVGQTKFVNVERLTGAPLTIQLSDMPEARALDILLRSASGYLLAPRAVPVANLSTFDRILVMPTSTPPRTGAGGGSTSTPPSAAPPAQFPPGLQPGENLDDDPIPSPPGGPGQRSGFPPQFPGGPQGSPTGAPSQRAPIFPQQPSPFPVPGGPGSVPSPGVQGGSFPGGPGGFPTAAPQGTMPVGVSVPGMVVQPVVPASPGQPVEPQ